MGACISIVSSSTTKNLIEKNDGGEEEYHKRFLEDEELGQGEFGVVKLVHDVINNDQMACKILRKGAVFKNNTLYSPIKSEVLIGEIQMLRTLAGNNYCMKLYNVYETPRSIYMITEFCSGGDLIEWISKQGETDNDNELSISDIIRITKQLYTAINHCYQNKIIHRDIKPENIMFTDPTNTAEVRLIDFGSGCIDDKNNDSNDDNQMHTTFAGSAFYISPEMFQRTYTALTDVWSCGVSVYVLVAGYPADNLQKAFNILQSNNTKTRNLKNLPNMPQDMPESFYDFLNQSLIYRHKLRPTAEKLLQHEFIVGGDDDETTPLLSLENITAHAAKGDDELEGSRRTNNTNRQQSIRGSVSRHTIFLGYKQFERAVTTVLAAMLSKQDLEKVLNALHDKAMEQQKQQQIEEEVQEQPEKDDVVIDEKKEADNPTDNKFPVTLLDGAIDNNKVNNNKLSVIKISELKVILQEQLDAKNSAQVLETLGKIPKAELYDNFAYHTAMLNDFIPVCNNMATLSSSLSARQRRQRSGSFRGGGSSVAINSSFRKNNNNRTSSFRRTNSFTNLKSFGIKNIATDSNRSSQSVRSNNSRRGSRRGRNSVQGKIIFNNNNNNNKSNNSHIQRAQSVAM